MTAADRRRARLVGRAAILAAAVIAGAGGCTVFGDDEPVASDSAATSSPPISVTVPPERLTPFCQAMIDLNERLTNDPPADVRGTIIAAYEEMVDVVPPEIEDDFLAVLARLQAGDGTAPTTTAPATTAAIPGTTSPFVDEGYDPDDDPALRLNSYVQFACRDNVNNPGPAATPPSAPPTTPA